MGWVIPRPADPFWNLKILKILKNWKNIWIERGPSRGSRRWLANAYRAVESSPLQVSGAVTRLTVYRALLHEMLQASHPVNANMDFLSTPCDQSVLLRKTTGTVCGPPHAKNYVRGRGKPRQPGNRARNLQSRGETTTTRTTTRLTITQEGKEHNNSKKTYKINNNNENNYYKKHVKWIFFEFVCISWYFYRRKNTR